MATAWYYAVDGVQYGPVNARELKSLVDSRKLLPAHMLWKSGLKNWVKAEKFKGLFDTPTITLSPLPPLPPLPQILSLPEISDQIQTQNEFSGDMGQPSSTNSNSKTVPTGVGGWLLLLVVGLMVLGPLIDAVLINADFLSAEARRPVLNSIPEWKTYKNATWLVFFIAAAISFYGALGLSMGRGWSVVRRTMAILWIRGPVATIAIAIIVPATIFGETNVDLGGLIASAITTGIWTVYLSKSKRVHNTYGGPKQTQSAPEKEAQFQIKEIGNRHRDISVPLALETSSNPDNENISDKKEQPTLAPTTSTKIIRFFLVSFYYVAGYLLLCTVANVIAVVIFPGRGLRQGGGFMVTAVNMGIICLLFVVHRGVLWILRYMRNSKVLSVPLPQQSERLPLEILSNLAGEKNPDHIKTKFLTIFISLSFLFIVVAIILIETIPLWKPLLGTLGQTTAPSRVSTSPTPAPAKIEKIALSGWTKEALEAHGEAIAKEAPKNNGGGTKAENPSVFQPYNLKHGITIKLPKHWQILESQLMDQTNTDTEIATGVGQGNNDIVIAANYYDGSMRRPAATVRVSVRTKQTASQSDILAMSQKDLDAAADQVYEATLSELLKSGDKTARITRCKMTKDIISGYVATRGEYQEIRPVSKSNVSIYILPLGNRTIKVAMSYDETQASLLMPTINEIKNSIQIRK